MFAFSTCWNSASHTDGEPMMDEIRALGFQNIELSHGIRVSLIEGIERALQKDSALKVSSLHNFCPLPVGYFHAAPNIYLLSSPDEEERERAIRQTLHTLDFAVKVKARFVVLHLGSVPMGDPVKKLRRMAQKGMSHTRTYRQHLQSCLDRRAELGKPHFLRTMKSLEKLAPAAKERGVILGIENRHDLTEIPSGNEFKEILKTFDASMLGYWHDSGHAETWHHLGIADHVEWLEQFADRLVGGHVHDVLHPDHDHKLPGEGTIPFQRLKPLKKESVLKVLELSPRLKDPLLGDRLHRFIAAWNSNQWLS